jgi:Ca2+-binding EF-hand superfamily protein
MALAMSHIAEAMISVGDSNEIEQKIYAPATQEEMDMMNEINLTTDGKLDKAGYILLCALRIGVMSPDLIKKIDERFKLLDINNDHQLSFDEISCKRIENPMREMLNHASSVQDVL